MMYYQGCESVKYLLIPVPASQKSYAFKFASTYSLFIL